MTITGWDHYTLRCHDLGTSWRFYAYVLGLRVVERTGVQVPAAIVYLDDMMLIHLFQASAEQEAEFAELAPPEAKWATGRLHHVALQARDLPQIRQRLAENNIAFTERTLTAAGKHLVVFKDPDGVELELAFGLFEAVAPE